MIDIEEVTGRPVSRETRGRLVRYVELLADEAIKQNLVARSTLNVVWERHVADSAQLLKIVENGGSWADVGSGAGLPGVIIAILTGDPVTLIEPRKLRADFLGQIKEALDLQNVNVAPCKAQSLAGSFDYITARAVAPAAELLSITSHLTHSGTKYLLMKGRTAKKELEDAQASWHGAYRLISSRTDPEAAIIVAEGVRRKGRNR